MFKKRGKNNLKSHHSEIFKTHLNTKDKIVH